MRGINRLAVLTVASSVALTACEDSGVIPEQEPQFAIVLQPEVATESASRVSLALSAPGEPSAAQIGLDMVESIRLPIGAVEALGSGNGGWIHAGAVEASVDLMALPEDGITLVDGSLPEGSYTALRFMLTDDATITLIEDVEVGRTLYEAGTHPLRIPSSEQNGVRLRSHFDVDDDGQVLTVLFDGDATVRAVTATGAGMLIIAPELRVEDEDGDDVGEIDDDERDGEDEVEAEGFVASVTDDGFTFEDGTVVVIHDETEIAGDLLSLAAVADALAGGETVRAEVEGDLDDDGTTIIASEVEFELDEDGEDDDEDDDEEED